MEPCQYLEILHYAQDDVIPKDDAIPKEHVIPSENEGSPECGTVPVFGDPSLRSG
ncbi:hypothetical protein [Legionella bononiensis]|uniref:hypothetical protein n=1 Tax=Legionella bononiensis TaxID=2793102 RepID=UPI0019330B96|nr:hypothetical protein [Legionella bononiensis]MBL7480406.1 hypothetical protein [Legionella bononiensis]MBL7563144.1 hypothetical protein [Legionella bononiensis]